MASGQDAKLFARVRTFSIHYGILLVLCEAACLPILASLYGHELGAGAQWQ